MSDQIKDRIVVPAFANESDEADWWFENREAHDEIMARAMSEGRTRNLRDVLKARGQELPRISLSFDYDDIQKAGKQAAALGLELESYVRGLLHEALKKDGAAS